MRLAGAAGGAAGGAPLPFHYTNNTHRDRFTRAHLCARAARTWLKHCVYHSLLPPRRHPLHAPKPWRAPRQRRAPVVLATVAAPGPSLGRPLLGPVDWILMPL